MNKEFAQKFADSWIDAWNHQNLDKILEFYAEGCEFSSPLIEKVLHKPIGELEGLAAIRNYWAEALKLVPNLSFELVAVLSGINSLIITYYGAHDTLSADVFYFDANNKVIKSSAYYEL
ncbi:MAG: nuclear transport factor 2 family protein [Neisseriales bacterium]|nr:MAG: nuclear transport factor 2 family protein [Neisseriales bacterium]